MTTTDEQAIMGTIKRTKREVDEQAAKCCQCLACDGGTIERAREIIVEDAQAFVKSGFLSREQAVAMVKKFDVYHGLDLED